MQNAETILDIIRDRGKRTARYGANHWRAGCVEIAHARFGGGLMEKAGASWTSPAAYPTLWGGGGGNAASLPGAKMGGTQERPLTLQRYGETPPSLVPP